jgi:hypothetical protein
MKPISSASPIVRPKLGEGNTVCLFLSWTLFKQSINTVLVLKNYWQK